MRIRGELENQRRLSCHATIQGDLVVDVPQDVQINRQIVRKRAETRADRARSDHAALLRRGDEPDMHKPLGDYRPDAAGACKGLALRRTQDRLRPVAEGAEDFCARGMESHGRRAHDRSGPVVTALWPGLHNFACGIAVDIGSTTIACHLSALLSGRALASAGIPTRRSASART